MSNISRLAFLAVSYVISGPVYSQTASQAQPGVSGLVYAQAGSQAPRGVRALTALPRLESHADIRAGALPGMPSGALRAPAPPLTEMWVYAVGSTSCGWEYTAGLSSTECDHGGEELRVAVLEIGYGASRIAWMNGGLLPSSAMYAHTPACVTGGSYTWPCTAGQTVVGFLVEYNLDGHQTGSFQYQNTSSNSPGNTLSTQIGIR